MKLQTSIKKIAQKGLNLWATFDCQQLPPTVTDPLKNKGVNADEYKRLVLIGHGGRQLWESLKTITQQTADPIDDFSTFHTKQFISETLENPKHLLLYPSTSYPIPLQQLGELAGWCHPSPLSLGINPTYGLWFAYRAAFLVDAELPLTTPSTHPSPCDSCTDKPCITTCPAGAAQPNKLDYIKCSHFRLREDSPCQDRCLARMACPVGTKHQYTLEQIQYHYGLSMETVRAYF